MIDRAADGDFEKERLKAVRIDLARELGGMERIKFPGIDDEAFLKLEGEAAALEAAGYDLSRITPIKDLTERLASGDMRMVTTECVTLVAPAGCKEEEIEGNSVFPRHLRIVDGMNEKLKELIEADRELYSLYH
ncbi:MAG: hypothetical protein WCX69_02500 [Candidatus Paceibacterota bacterium]